MLNHKDLDRYLDIYYQQTSNDWNSNPGKNTKVVTKYAARQCTQADFGNTDVDKAYFKAWTGFSLICPDLPKGTTFSLLNSQSDNLSKSFQFSISRCDNKIRKKEGKPENCFDKPKQNEFIKDIQVDTL